MTEQRIGIAARPTSPGLDVSWSTAAYEMGRQDEEGAVGNRLLPPAPIDTDSQSNEVSSADEKGRETTTTKEPPSAGTLSPVANVPDGFGEREPPHFLLLKSLSSTSYPTPAISIDEADAAYAEEDSQDDGAASDDVSETDSHRHLRRQFAERDVEEAVREATRLAAEALKASEDANAAMKSLSAARTPERKKKNTANVSPSVEEEKKQRHAELERNVAAVRQLSEAAAIATVATARASEAELAVERASPPRMRKHHHQQRQKEVDAAVTPTNEEAERQARGMIPGAVAVAEEGTSVMSETTEVEPYMKPQASAPSSSAPTGVSNHNTVAVRTVEEDSDPLIVVPPSMDRAVAMIVPPRTDDGNEQTNDEPEWMLQIRLVRREAERERALSLSRARSPPVVVPTRPFSPAPVSVTTAASMDYDALEEMRERQEASLLPRPSGDEDGIDESAFFPSAAAAAAIRRAEDSGVPLTITAEDDNDGKNDDSNDDASSTAAEEDEEDEDGGVEPQWLAEIKRVRFAEDERREKQWRPPTPHPKDDADADATDDDADAAAPTKEEKDNETDNEDNGNAVEDNKPDWLLAIERVREEEALLVARDRSFKKAARALRLLEEAAQEEAATRAAEEEEAVQEVERLSAGIAATTTATKTSVRERSDPVLSARSVSSSTSVLKEKSTEEATTTPQQGEDFASDAEKMKYLLDEARADVWGAVTYLKAEEERLNRAVSLTSSVSPSKEKTRDATTMQPVPGEDFESEAEKISYLLDEAKADVGRATSYVRNSLVLPSISPYSLKKLATSTRALPASPTPSSLSPSPSPSPSSPPPPPRQVHIPTTSWADRYVAALEEEGAANRARREAELEEGGGPAETTPLAAPAAAADDESLLRARIAAAMKEEDRSPRSAFLPCGTMTLEAVGGNVEALYNNGA